MKRPKYKFYLNSYDFYKWSRCLECDGKTKLRKFCLVIHYEEKKKNFMQLISLNKSCKFCPYCELIIGQKSELDELLDQIITFLNLKFNPKNYIVFGTMEKKDWKKSQDESLSQKEAIKLVHRFKDILEFEIRPGGWYFEGEYTKIL